MHTAILKPLGMNDSGYDSVAVGYTTGTTLAFPLNMTIPHAARALYSTAPDLLRWQLTMLRTLLGPSGTETMTTPAVTDTEVPGFGYSYGILVSLDADKPVLIHEGGIDGFLSRLRHDTSTGITVVVLTNHEDATRLEYIDQVLTQSAPG